MWISDSVLNPLEASVVFASPLNRQGKTQASLVAQMVKKSACNAGDLGWIPGLGRARWATVPGVAKSWTLLSNFQQMNTFEFLSCSEPCPRSCCQREVNTGFKPREFDSNNS